MKDRILIADDEQPSRETVSSILSAANYTCLECDSGVDALETLTSDGPFQLVLYDLTMKDVDGITFADHTKQSFPDTLLVVVASVHDISVALAAIRNGAYDYLLKPFDREQLLDTVSRALENNRLRVENRTYQANLDSLVKARTEQLQTTVGNLERSNDITLEALNDAMNVKDRETGQRHVRRVTLFTIAIAQATVVSVTPDGVGVDSDYGFAQFDKDGKETEDSRYRRVGGLPTMPPEWQAWELRPLDKVNLVRNVSVWLIKFLKDGEKPADEIFKEAEKKFDDAGDAVREASDSLGVSKRQENRRWYWSMRWELDENNRVIGPARNHRRVETSAP